MNEALATEFCKSCQDPCVSLRGPRSTANRLFGQEDLNFGFYCAIRCATFGRSVEKFCSGIPEVGPLREDQVQTGGSNQPPLSVYLDSEEVDGTRHWCRAPPPVKLNRHLWEAPAASVYASKNSDRLCHCIPHARIRLRPKWHSFNEKWHSKTLIYL